MRSMRTWLPVASIIHERQQEYYDAINAPNNEGASTKFITFMLSAVKSAIMEALNVSDEMMDDHLAPTGKRWLYKNLLIPQPSGNLSGREVLQPPFVW